MFNNLDKSLSKLRSLKNRNVSNYSFIFNIKLLVTILQNYIYVGKVFFFPSSHKNVVSYAYFLKLYPPQKQNKQNIQSVLIFIYRFPICKFSNSLIIICNSKISTCCVFLAIHEHAKLIYKNDLHRNFLATFQLTIIILNSLV